MIRYGSKWKFFCLSVYHWLFTAGFPKKIRTVSGKILNVEGPVPGHYHRPELEVNLTEEIILHPERFPLQAK
jgi:hypothetical protein